jgi:hypothetical protein
MAIGSYPGETDAQAGNGYLLEPRGTINIKGKGDMKTWLLVGRS